jgi:hypothetical protein
MREGSKRSTFRDRRSAFGVHVAQSSMAKSQATLIVFVLINRPNSMIILETPAIGKLCPLNAKR